MSSSTCYHCGLTNPDKPLKLSIDGDLKTFCCTGCQQAAKTILDSGLGEYYRFHVPDQQPANIQLNAKKAQTFELYDREDVQAEFVQNIDSSEETQRQCILSIEGISCSACTWLIEKRLLQLNGVTSAVVNAGTHRLTLTWNNDRTLLSEILTAIYLIGYQARPFLLEEEEKQKIRTQKKYILRLGAAGIGTMQAMMNAVALYSGAISDQHEIWLWWTSLALTLPVMLISAWPFFESAWTNLRHKNLTMDVSVTLAIVSAFAASVYATVIGHGEVYYESISMFTFFLVLSRFLEFRARNSSDSTLSNSIALKTQLCTRISNGRIENIASQDVESGDILRLMPGEICPYDGTVSHGTSEFDESSLTGEFKAIVKKSGDKITAGTINQQQAIEFKVSQGKQKAFQLLESLIERGASEKSRMALLADRGAKQFILSTLIVTAFIGAIWLWIDPSRAFWIVISVLVVTCPCALSLATPTALAQATTSLKKQGFIVTRGYALERLSNIEAIAFDKTGTLTEGQFSVSSIELTEFAIANNLDTEAVMSLCQSLEQNSNHAIASAFQKSPDDKPTIQLSNIRNIAGYGVQATNAEGEWFFGSAKQQKSSTTSEKTELVLTLNDELIASVFLTDSIRPSASSAVSQLAKSQIETNVLTGDPQHNLAEKFYKLGISGRYVAGCTADRKVDWIKQHRTPQSLAVVGDGLNDAPLLASAPLSIAMLNATDMTKSQADVLMLTTDLKVIPDAIKLSKRTQRIIRQNLSWALIYNAIALPVAAFGFVSPWQAAIGMSLSSLLVVGNALRLRN